MCGVTTLVTAPISEPVSVKQLRDQVRQTENFEDATVLPIYITAAREHLEETIGVAISPATWKLTLDRFPCGPIEIYKWPLISIDSVKYVGQDAAQLTWAVDQYYTDLLSAPARIVPLYGEPYPIVRSGGMNNVEIQYTAGYDNNFAAMPSGLKLAILLLAADWHDNRVDTTDKEMKKIPNGIQRLIRQYRKGYQ